MTKLDIPIAALKLSGSGEIEMDFSAELPRRIHMILEEGATFGESRVAFTDENGIDWSYRRLIDTVEAVSSELRELGIRPGDRMMIVCENSIGAIVLMYAASRLDAWAVLANARLSKHELALIEEDCQPRRIFRTHPNVSATDAGDDNADVRLFTGIGAVTIGPLNENSAPEEVHEGSAEQVAVLVYTTGTTGRPKGVMLSHRNLTFVSSRGRRTQTLSRDDVALCVMPISHSYGLVLMQGMLYAGARMKIMPRFSLQEALDAVRSGELTIFNAVPAMLTRVVAHVEQTGEKLTPNNLRYAYTGTAPLDLSLRKNVERLFGVVLQNGYGLTETSPTISRSRYSMGSDEVNIGPPIQGVEIRIVGPDGLDVPEGQPGELLVRGPNVMLGYYRQPKATAEVIDEDGYLHTGDIVSRNDRGELVIQGRSKELIIRSGFNVYPPEVEAALNAHPSILNSAVVGRPVEGNEEIIAFVEMLPERRCETDDIKSFLKSRLAQYKLPQQIIVMQNLPIAPNGKIKKNDLKKYLDNLSDPMVTCFRERSGS
ncbi:AMP-dependent synthetase [Pseudorhizobium halotolerans]|jgi:acyl-CoA synthetase (AMP-forming)/AMP-acid ligase II|nr:MULTISPECIES: class I adenylate-forming enzyme family protein [Hyphomicrobiales]CAD7026331.1 AMP-dependent synthetase [Pseudorhizobium halotolerans]